MRHGLAILWAVAAAQIVLALGALVFAPDQLRPGSIPFPLAVANLLAFGGAAVLLLLGGRRDVRAAYLGTFLLLIASTFSNDPLHGLASRLPGSWGAGVSRLNQIEADAFMPWLLWLFVRDFPEAPATLRVKRIIRLGISVSASVGVILFAGNLVLGVTASRFSAPGLISREAAYGLYYPLLLGLEAAALPVAIQKARMASLVERRRLRIFLAALGAGLGPLAVAVALESSFPAYRRLVTQSPGWLVTPYFLAIAALHLMMPFAIAYSVLVQRVLDVRVVIRQAIQYAFARYSLIGLVVAPFAGLAAHAWRNRQQTLLQIFEGVPWYLLIAVPLLGLAALAWRSRVLNALDRRFFRERYDARRALSSLVAACRRASSNEELAGLLTREIDRALHLETVTAFLHDPSTGLLIAGGGRLRPLDSTCPLAMLIAGSPEPLDVDLENPRSALMRLPMGERQWLADGGFRLVVPIFSGEGALAGIIALGEKRSELNFDAEDRGLLAAIASAAGLSFENRQLRVGRVAQTEGPDSRRHEPRLAATADDRAVECGGCGSLYPSGTRLCEACQQPLVPASVPYILAGKFRFECRIGSGGMGIVYRARDLALGRPVAIKTLPRISPAAAAGLRHEARAAARVAHPSLATIHGVESWHGVPMLIFEFLEGGTLADRLVHGSLGPEAAVRLGVDLAGALQRAHDSGLLHGDIKPSNIGYDAAGAPKLLDFGVARILRESRSAEPVTAVEADQSIATTRFAPLTDEGAAETPSRAGTLAYLSPQALDGESPDPSFDLWSLALVIYESLAGRNPLSDRSPLEVMERIRRADVPDVRTYRPDCPATLASFLEEALARDPGRRPATAAVFGARLARATHVVAA